MPMVSSNIKKATYLSFGLLQPAACIYNYWRHLLHYQVSLRYLLPAFPQLIGTHTYQKNVCGETYRSIKRREFSPAGRKCVSLFCHRMSGWWYALDCPRICNDNVHLEKLQITGFMHLVVLISWGGRAEPRLPIASHLPCFLLRNQKLTDPSLLLPVATLLHYFLKTRRLK